MHVLFHLFVVWILVCCEVKGSKICLLWCQVIHSSPSELSEGMLHSAVLQWPCNAILHAGPSGQILWASISCQRDQHSIFSLGLLWKPWERSGDDSILIAEGHLHTRLFPALLCPSQVDLTGRHRPRTSWIMHYGRTLYSTYCALLLAVFTAADSGSLFWAVQLSFSLSWNLILWITNCRVFHSSVWCTFPQ